MNSSNDEKAYWESVVQKLESNDASVRGWASHVLATDFPREEESNLAFALRYCGHHRVIERAHYLSVHDTDEYAGSNCLHILKRLKEEPNQPTQRNADSRPSSDDSSASETPSSPGPRG